MSITPSSATEIRALIDALSSPDQVRRESAIARLAIIGPRAVQRLVVAYEPADRDTRIAILRVAEAIADPRALTISMQALAAGGDLAAAAAASLRSLLASRDERTATDALDALVKTALDSNAERAVRMAAFEALQDMPAEIRDRVGEALTQDSQAAIQITAAPASGPDLDAVWQDAIDGRLPEAPVALKAAVKARAGREALSVLQSLVDAVRQREEDVGSTAGARRDAWTQVRGALHQALGSRGSRVALYDLRETIAAARQPLPPGFLTAAQAVGDASCLEPIAAAWSGAEDGDRGNAAAWRHQLEATFSAIVRRERISTRSAAIKRIAARHPAAAAALSTTSRTTPRPKPRRRT